MVLVEQSNIFGFHNPDNWECRVVSYEGPSIMMIELKDPDTASILLLTLAAVQHYVGPFMWKGASFGIGASKKCVELTQSLPHLEQLDEEYINWRFKLYILDISKPVDYQLQILAASTTSLQKGEEIAHYDFR